LFNKKKKSIDEVGSVIGRTGCSRLQLADEVSIVIPHLLRDLCVDGEIFLLKFVNSKCAVKFWIPRQVRNDNKKVSKKDEVRVWNTTDSVGGSLF